MSRSGNHSVRSVTTCPTSLFSRPAIGAAVALPRFISSRSRPALPAVQPGRLPPPGADAARSRVPMATGAPLRHAGGYKPRPAGRPCARARCVAARREGRSVRRRRGPDSEAGGGGGFAWRPSRLSPTCRHVRAQQAGHRRHLQAAPLRAHQQGEGAGTRRGRGRAPPL